MASAGNWSVVGKTKKAKSPSQPMSKTQKKQFIDNMPRIDPLEPVKECSTIYDAFVAQEQNRQTKKKQEKFADKIESSREPNNKGISDGGQKKKASSTRKKAEQGQRKRPFEEAIKLVKEEDLKSVLLQSQGHFPDKPELWLKDLVTCLNLKLECCPDTDKYLQPSNKDYPASLMKKGCTKVITSTLNDCNQATLEHVLYFCLMTMLEESQNGNSTYGYKIFLQLMARAKPDIVIAKLTQCQEIVRSTLNRPDRCLSILWAVGQVGYVSLRNGLRVWLDLMLPHFGLPKLGNYCIQYLENLLSLHSKDLDAAAGEIKLKEYFHLLDLVYGTMLPTDLRKRLLKLYPQLKRIVYGKGQSTQYRHFFPSYLTRASTSGSADLKAEVLACLTECLSKDKQSYSLWCQLYLKHLTQSRVFLEDLTAKWDSVSGKVDQKLLQQTLMTFLRTNEEMSQSRNTPEWTNMTTVCEELLKKMTRPRFPWRWVVFFLISTVVAIVAYDVHTSKTFKNSRTVGFLEAYGVLGFFQQILTSVALYSSLTREWLQVNVPVYWNLAYTTVTPYVVRFVDFCSHLEEYTREHRKLAVDKFQNIVTKEETAPLGAVSLFATMFLNVVFCKDVKTHFYEIYAISPDFWREFGRYIAMCWDFIIDYSYWIYGHIAEYSHLLYLWVDINIIKGNLSTESLQETFSWSANKVQHFTETALEWCKQLWT